MIRSDIDRRAKRYVPRQCVSDWGMHKDAENGPQPAQGRRGEAFQARGCQGKGSASFDQRSGAHRRGSSGAWQPVADLVRAWERTRGLTGGD